MADMRADAEAIVSELSGQLSPDHPAARVVRVAEAVLAMLPVCEAARARIRHDHAYPMEVGAHHCPGCDLEAAIDAVLSGREDR